jgi:hypothetical protein
MHIFYNGCSYTWGDELQNKEQERYGTLVSNHYNASHVNISERGRSNDAIARTTMEWFINGNTCDLAIIQWTVISRIDGYDPLRKQYIFVTTQTQTKWAEYYKKYYHDQLGVDTLFKNYYILEQFFIQKNIPYFFLFHDCWNDTIFTLDSVWKNLIIKKDFHVIKGNDYHKTILDEIHFEGTKGHPNSLGHQSIANYIIDNIGNFQ